jgi:hypothetical protein
MTAVSSWKDVDPLAYRPRLIQYGQPTHTLMEVIDFIGYVPGGAYLP